MTSMMRPTANRPTQNTYGAQQPSMNQYKPGQAQPQQQSQGTPYQAYTPNANERPQYGQPPSAPRSPQSDFRQVGEGGLTVMTPWYNPQTGQTYQTGSSNFQPVEGSGWMRAPRGGQAAPGWSAPQGANERISPMQPPPFQMAPAQTPWGPSMDPFAERDAFVNQINQQRMQNQIAFNSGGPTNPAAGMTPGIDYQLAMQQAGLAGGAPSMSPEYGDSLIARLNSQFGGQGDPFANQTQAAPFQSPFSIPSAPQQPAYYPGGTMNDGYGMGQPPSLGGARDMMARPPLVMDPQQAPAYGQDSAFDSWLQQRQQGRYRDMRHRSAEELMRERQDDYQEYLTGGGQGGRSDGVFEWRPPAVTPPRPSPAPRPRLSPAAEEFQEKIARRTDPSRRTLASTPRPPASNRDVQAAFENPSAWQYQDPQEAGRLAREAGKDSQQAYNAANKNNWLGPDSQRAVRNMSPSNQRIYLAMAGFNQNEVNDYMKRNSGKGKKKR